MNKISFFKYQEAGNDFVVLDNLDCKFSGISANRVAKLCDRRFGIGGDGLLLLSPSDGSFSFRMEYFNQDGSRASFCGNGARCICAFAVAQGAVNAYTEFSFIADDGPHMACVYPESDWVELQMKNVDRVSLQPDGAYVLDTGVPHYVRFVDDLDGLDIMSVAPKIRYSQLYAPAGVNVNFVSVESESHISIRTYERGVEGETLACGTGITAAAIASSLKTSASKFDVSAKGGELSVSFSRNEDGSFSKVLLAGPAKAVFSGTTDLL